MTPFQRRLRAGLILVVGLFLLLEASRYLATGLWRQQFEVLPKLGVRASGEVVRWDARLVEDGPNQSHYEGNVRDAEGRPTGWTRAPDALRDCLATAWLGQPQMEESPLYRSGSYGPPWMPLSRWAALRRSGGPAPWAGATMPVPFALSQRFGAGNDGSTWSLENGRVLRSGPRPTFVRRGDTWSRPDPDPNLIGGLGPDGWRAGPDGAKGERFGDPWVVGTYSEVVKKSAEFETTLVLADSGLRSVFFVRARTAADAPVGAAPSATAPSISVERLPLPGEGDIRPLPGYAASQGTIAVAVGPEIVALSVKGNVLGQVRTDAGEAPLATFAGAWPVAPRLPDGLPPVVVASLPSPVRVIGAGVRFRVFTGEGAPVVADAVVEPVTAGEHAMAWFRRSLAIVRPPILSLASFVSPAPANYEEMFSAWLLDPLYAGRSEPLTLVLCLGLGVFCAVRMRRQAQWRTPAPRDVAFWTAAGALLGPVGIVWMRLVVPRDAVRACACGARRAVSVETCPPCGASWPAPARTGTEVMYGA